MLKLAQREHAEEMRQLIPKMRRGECSVLETWKIQHFMQEGWVLDKETLELLEGIPVQCESPHDAWLKGWMSCGSARHQTKIWDILRPHELDPLCAALLGRVYADFSMGSQALSCWKRSAEAGCAEGMYRYGTSYYSVAKNDGKDDEDDVNLFYMAAQMIHPGAIYQLAAYYEHGVGTGKDTKRAFQLYEQASALGDSSATIVLAKKYLKGRDTTRDLRRAASLYRKALLQGDDDADRLLNKLKIEDYLAVIPYGEWQPDPFMHQFVPISIHFRCKRSSWRMRAKVLCLPCFLEISCCVTFYSGCAPIHF